MGRAARAWHLRRSFNGHRRSTPMSQDFRFDPSRSLTTLEQDSTIIAVIEMSQTKWLVAAVVSGVERQHLATNGHAGKTSMSTSKKATKALSQIAHPPTQSFHFDEWALAFFDWAERL